MAETTTGQVSAYFELMSAYYSAMQTYLANPSGEAPLFLESLPDIKFSQVITDSQNRAKGNPSMVSGALIESASSMFATIREAGMRSKIRSDFFAESTSESAQDSKFYTEQGCVLLSFINGRNDTQN